MKYATVFSVSLLSSVGAFPGPTHNKRSINSTLFSEFTRAAKLAHCAYQPICVSPVETTRLHTIYNLIFDTDGFIARDDTKKQIIVAMRGTSSLSDILVDLDNTLVPYTSTSSTECSGCMVHRGFQNQWNAVVADVIEKVGEQVKAHSDYTLLCTGHSLGGALTPFCAVSLEKNFPGKVTAISLASPRTGNPAWISFVEATIPSAKLFRLTNQNDTVPNDLTEAEGFKHHATEHWSAERPVTEGNMVVCNGGEDASCNKGHSKENAGFLGINEAHFHYMNVDFANSTAAEC